MPIKVLQETKWLVSGPSRATTRLGMKRTTLEARMQKLGITRRSSWVSSMIAYDVIRAGTAARAPERIVCRRPPMILGSIVPVFFAEVHG